MTGDGHGVGVGGCYLVEVGALEVAIWRLEAGGWSADPSVGIHIITILSTAAAFAKSSSGLITRRGPRLAPQANVCHMSGPRVSTRCWPLGPQTITALALRE